MAYILPINGEVLRQNDKPDQWTLWAQGVEQLMMPTQAEGDERVVWVLEGHTVAPKVQKKGKKKLWGLFLQNPHPPRDHRGFADANASRTLPILICSK
jgi:hypothetical protein